MKNTPKNRAVAKVQRRVIDQEPSSELPLISVITPSFNQGKYIEKTILSVLSQDYPNFEYIVVDGGSTDETVSIIRRYADSLAYWVSEPDQGQAHAINKGFMRCTGQIMCWLNSDDRFEPGALQKVARHFSGHSGVSAIAGHVHVLSATGNLLWSQRSEFSSRRRLAEYWKGYQMHQSSIFWRREVWERVGGLDESLFYTMDFDYWLRMSKFYSFAVLDEYLSSAVRHPEAKTGRDFGKYSRAQMAVVMRHFGWPIAIADWGIRLSLYRCLFAKLVDRLCGRPGCPTLTDDMAAGNE